MKKLAAAWIFAAALAAGVLVAAGQLIFPSAPNLLPIPRLAGPFSDDVVVVEAAPDSQPGGQPSGPGSAAPSTGFPFRDFGAVPVSGDGALDLDIPRLGGFDGYVRNGRVTLALGLEGLGAVIERRLAVLSAGACGSFESWTVTTESALLPDGSCALYRVVLGGSVIYETDQPVRHDGTKPLLADVDVAEEGAREHEAGATLFVAANAENLKPVTISADASDPESGLQSASFRIDGVEVGVSEAPWSAQLSPTPGTIEVTVTNSAGDTATGSVSVVADGASPTGGTISYPSVALPGEAVAIATDPGSDSGAGIDLSSLVIERRLASLTDAGCEAFGDWASTYASDTAREGTCAQYRLRIKDNVANEAIFQSETTLTVVDTTAPETAITAPAAGIELNGVTTVSATASDAGAGIRSIAIQVSKVGKDDWTELGVAESNGLSVDWDTILVDPGAYLLRSLAVDEAGNSAYSEVVAVVVAADEVAPSTSIVSPAYSETVSGTVTVSAEAADAGAGVESVSIWVRGRCGGWIELGSFSGTSGSVAWDTTAFEPGRYQIRSVAVDRRGNKSVSAPVKVYVKSPPPAEEPESEPPAEESAEEPASSDDEDEVKGEEEGTDKDDGEGEGEGEGQTTSGSTGDDAAQADDSTEAEEGGDQSVEYSEDEAKTDDGGRD